MSESDGPKRGRKKKGGEIDPGAGDQGASPSAEPARKPEPAVNPWLQPGDDTAQRRSARMEDILRARRPGGVSILRRGGNALWLWGGLGMLSALLLSTSIHVLQPGESGLVTTLGRFSGTIGPGLNLTLPWPFQHVISRQTGKEQTLLLPDKDTETLMLTLDGQLIDVRTQVRWKVSDLRAYTFATSDSEAALRRLADSTIRAAVAEQTFDQLRGGQARAELQQRIGGRMQRVLDGWHAGISLAGVDLTATNAPAQLAETFKKIGKANEDSRKNHEAAVAYSARIRSKAETETAAFDKAYEMYKIAPRVTRERIYYETVEQVLQNNPVTIGGSSGTALPAPPATEKSAAKAEGQ